MVVNNKRIKRKYIRIIHHIERSYPQVIKRARQKGSTLPFDGKVEPFWCFAIISEMTRKVKFSENEYYHVYNRGVDKRTVFENDSDHKRFCMLLYLCNQESPVRFDHLPEWKGSTSPELIASVFYADNPKPLVAIGAYCLMPNHFHILVKEINDGGITKFMQKLSTAYTMYFNSGRKRSGALFQGRFKAEHVNTDTYLKYLFAYIHLNPVKLIEPKWKVVGILNKQKIFDFLNAYPYSSYLDYLDSSREFSKILERKKFPDYFPSRKDFKSEIADWINFDN